jgi:hypothetical protein
MSADPVKEFTTLCDIEREGSLSQLLVAPQHRRSAGIGENEQTSNEATEEADHERDNEDPFSAGDPLPVTTPYQIQGYFNAEPPQSIQALQRETQVPSPVTLVSRQTYISCDQINSYDSGEISANRSIVVAVITFPRNRQPAANGPQACGWWWQTHKLDYESNTSSPGRLCCLGGEMCARQHDDGQ